MESVTSSPSLSCDEEPEHWITPEPLPRPFFLDEHADEVIGADQDAMESALKAIPKKIGYVHVAFLLKHDLPYPNWHNLHSFDRTPRTFSFRTNLSFYDGVDHSRSLTNTDAHLFQLCSSHHPLFLRPNLRMWFVRYDEHEHFTLTGRGFNEPYYRDYSLIGEL